MRNKILLLLIIITAINSFSQEQDYWYDSDNYDQTENVVEKGSWYEGKPIKQIVLNGLKLTKSSEIEALVVPYRGILFSYEKYEELYMKLFALEFFSNIKVDIKASDEQGSGVILIFNVIERPMVRKIIFNGISGLRRNDLMEAISIKETDIINQSKIREDEKAIREKYKQKGYPNASVNARETRSAKDSSITLIFDIVEGRKVTVVDIRFENNTVFKESTLKGLLSHKAKALFNDGAFQEANLQLDIEAVAKYYHDRGYIDAEVFCTPVPAVITTNEKGKKVIIPADTETISDDESTTLILVFKVTEGVKYTFNGITFEDNKIFSTEQLTKLVRSKTGDTVNKSRVLADLQRVSDLYYENGYIFNKIDWIENKSTDNESGVLSYTIKIIERGRAHIENIIIKGNQKTKNDVILREIPLEPGDVFSKAKVMDAMRNLYNLQFFSVILPETPEGSEESLMDLVFTVEEQPTIDLQFGLTFSGSADPETFPISGLLKWNDRNLAGTGNQLGAELNSSVIDTTSFSLNYLHRWVFGLPLSAGMDFTLNYAKRLATMNNSGRIFNGDEPYAYPDGFGSYDEYISYNKLPTRDYLMEYEQLYLSLGLSSGYRWTTMLGIFGIGGGIRVGIIRNSYDETILRPFDPALREGNNTWMPKNSFWFSLSLDQRDIFYDPTRGYYLYQRMGYYGVLEQEREHYMRSDSKGEIYFKLWDVPVTEKWDFKGVLAFHSGLSFIFKQPGRNIDDLKPSVEEGNMLSVDGMFVGRGWSSEYRNKGLLLFENWVELRFPIVRGILAFDLFFDAAGVETDKGFYFGGNDNGEVNFTYKNMRYSYGGGIRFTLPQFPFRLSLAKRFSFRDGEFAWEPGQLFRDASSDDPAQGMDLVISFLLSY
jgi:outer membrane protein insertion porin family